MRNPWASVVDGSWGAAYDAFALVVVGGADAFISPTSSSPIDRVSQTFVGLNP
jgi:hypothetical protein